MAKIIFEKVTKVCVYHPSKDQLCIFPIFPGGHLNTSVVHMRDQRSKHTLIAISPFQGKDPMKENFACFPHKFTPKHFFWMVEFEKITPKRPLKNLKEPLFSKIGTFGPLNAIRANRFQP